METSKPTSIRDSITLPDKNQNLAGARYENQTFFDEAVG